VSVSAPKLHHVRVEKFRRIRDVVELDLRAPRGRPSSLAVLAGPNGCGKSSLLEAVLLGLGQEALIVRDLDEPDEESSWRTSIPEGARIELTVSLDGGPEETWVRTRHEFLNKKGDGAWEDFADQFDGGRPSLSVEYFSSWRAPVLVGPVRPLESGRRLTNNETNRLWRLKQRIADEYMRFGLRRSLRGAASSKPEAWLEQLNRAWRRFHRSDGTEIVPDIVEREGKEGDFLDLFVMRGKDRVCSIDQISSGEIEVILFAQWVILNDVRAGLLVIDEPELHLHPSWQATILPALRELAPEVQFLVATHSDAVWDQASERFLLVDESDPRSQAWRKAHALPSDDEAAS
jgi:predicted ATPase